ncbi:hypothetical protein [Desulfotignum phosphitoxidans]|uniref:Uncharacterized protein n=1 Tax=Desulfotignum phosphitoxidans DSM 13687 TaxID=1286635 RepID=S0FWX0_9BACT|nr:hypothetical protein [Desulfotignum phosphitoxidans]EMS79195.1 hypothetical protein Dpo_5c01180 [Desulfotignum phosphitoxidans DSM 13687]
MNALSYNLASSRSTDMGRYHTRDLGGAFVVSYVKDYCNDMLANDATFPKTSKRSIKIQQLDYSLHNNTSALDKIIDNFDLIDTGAVELFLTEHPEIIPTVNESFYKIKEYFPEDINLTLEIFTDPESSQKSLLLRIFSKLPVEEAMEKLEALDRNWFLEKFLSSDNLFSITLDFE